MDTDGRTRVESGHNAAVGQARHVDHHWCPRSELKVGMLTPACVATENQIREREKTLLSANILSTLHAPFAVFTQLPGHTHVRATNK